MLSYTADGQTPSAAFAQAMQDSTVSYDMKLYTVGSNQSRTLIGGIIKKAKITLGAGDDYGADTHDIQIGALTTTTFEATIFSSDEYPIATRKTWGELKEQTWQQVKTQQWYYYVYSGFRIGSMIEVRVGVLAGQDYEYYAVGHVFISEIKTHNNLTTLKGIGIAGNEFNVPVEFAAGDYTISTLAGLIKSSTGRTLYMANKYSDKWNALIPVLETDTYRDVLARIATRLGGFVGETVIRDQRDDGSYYMMSYVCILAYANYASVFDTTQFVTDVSELSTQLYTIDGLTIVGAGGLETIEGTGKPVVKDPTFQRGEQNIAWNNLKGYWYYPGSVTAACINPRVRPGDKLTVISDGTSYTVSALGISATYDGGFYGTYSSTGLTSIGQDIAEGPLQQGVSAAALAAEEAASAAAAINQHFWHNSNGAHVTDEPQDDYLLAQDEGFPDWDSDPDSLTYKPWFALLLNSLGQLFKTGKYFLASFTHSAIAFFDGLWDGSGTGDEHVVATFGTNGYQVGQLGKARQLGDYHSLQLIDKDNISFFHISDLRGQNGYATITEESTIEAGYSSTTFSTSYPIRSKATTSATANGTTVTISSVASYSVTLASAVFGAATVQITYQTNSDECKAFSIGQRQDQAAKVGGNSASIIGKEASGFSAIAIGRGAAATGVDSIALGWATSSGMNSMAIGGDSKSKGQFSFSSGWGTYASGRSTFAIGEWNTNGNQAETARNTYAFVIGNGSGEGARSNALGVRWDGRVDIGGSTLNFAVQKTSSGRVTAVSGYTITEQSMTQWGKVITLRLRVTSTAATSGDRAVATIASGYRPTYLTIGQEWEPTRACYVDANGSVHIKGAMAAGAGSVMSFMYIIP